MGIPMITCAICGAQVTKRQSLLIEPFGRICRSHPEVEQHKQEVSRKVADARAKLEADNVMKESMKQINKTMSVISLTSFIRSVAYTQQLSLEYTFLALSDRIPGDVIKDVAKAVFEQGPITDAEFNSSLSTFLHMQRLCKGI